MESFEAHRLLRVYAGPVRVGTQSALVVLRSLEAYVEGVAVVWTCSPAAGSVARLAQSVPRVSLALGDGFEPLGEATSGGGRTLFGSSFFAGTVARDAASLDVLVRLSGATGAGVEIEARASFPLGTAAGPQV